MNLLPNDIITRKANGKETLWVSQRLLVEVCGIADEYLRKIRSNYKSDSRNCDLAKVKSFMPEGRKAWRWARVHGQFYYCWDNIPDRKPTYYRSKLGTKSSLKAQLKEVSKSLKTLVGDNAKISLKDQAKKLTDNHDAYYFMYESDTGFTRKEALEMAEALSWCKMLQTLYINQDFKALGILDKQQFLQVAVEILEKEKLTGLTVTSASYLRRKIVDFPAEKATQREYMISGRYNNQNARKVGKLELVDEETGEVFGLDLHEAMMFNFYINKRIGTKEAIIQLYEKYYVPGIREFGFEPVSYRTVKRYLAMWHKRLATDKGRHGEDYFKKHTLTYVPSKRLQYSHSLFVGDGSGTISYKYYKKNAKGSKDLNTMKLYVILISDVASRKIVGWAPAPQGQHLESPEMVEVAVKMALKNCEYQTMFEFLSDNHGAFTGDKSRAILNLVFNKVRTIEPGNSQANFAETEFRLFKQHLRAELNFVSSSWNVGIEGQVNPDRFTVEALPDYSDAVIQFGKIVEEWNSRKLRDETTPNERYENRNPKCTHIDNRVLRQIFGTKTKVDPTLYRGFIKVARTKGYHHREDFIFEIPDIEETGAEKITKAIGYARNGQVQVIWDEEAADIYTLAGAYVMTCYPAEMSSNAYIESDAQSDHALGHHLKRKQKITEKADEYTAMLEEFDEALPYVLAMKAGGSKESFNGLHNAIENRQNLENDEEKDIKKARRERNERDFNSDEWKDLDNENL